MDRDIRERRQRAINTVSNMIISGWSDARISSCTGMSKHELAHFRKMLNRPAPINPATIPHEAFA